MQKYTYFMVFKNCKKKKRNTADIKVNDLHCIVKVRFFQILPFV